MAGTIHHVVWCCIVLASWAIVISEWTNHLWPWIPDSFQKMSQISTCQPSTLFSPTHWLLPSALPAGLPDNHVSGQIQNLQTRQARQVLHHGLVSGSAADGQIKSAGLLENGRIHQGGVCKRHSLGLHQALYLYTTLEGCDHHVFPTNPLTGITVANCGLQTALTKMDTRNPLKKSDCFSKIYMYFACIHSTQIRWIRTEALYHVHCSMYYVRIVYSGPPWVYMTHWSWWEMRTQMIHICKNFRVLKRVVFKYYGKQPLKFHGFSYDIVVQFPGLSNTVSQQDKNRLPHNTIALQGQEL